MPSIHAHRETYHIAAAPSQHWAIKILRRCWRWL